MSSLYGRHIRFWGTRECGRSQGLPQLFWLSLLTQERVKLRTSNLAGIHRIHPSKSPLKILEKRERGRSQQPENFHGSHIIYRAHCAVIFAIAQLSCLF